jgi:ABC-type nitrate/sulfonate/bicarbonate transport system substrate-binding protein
MVVYRFTMSHLAVASTRLVLALFFTVISSASAYTQNLPLFRIANGTSGENPAVFWVGVDQGFFRKHGLNVEVVYMRAGSLSISALPPATCRWFSYRSNAVLNVVAGGLDVAIIGSSSTGPKVILWRARRSSGPKISKFVAIQYRRRRLGK